MSLAEEIAPASDAAYGFVGSEDAVLEGASQTAAPELLPPNSAPVSYPPRFSRSRFQNPPCREVVARRNNALKHESRRVQCGPDALPTPPNCDSVSGRHLLGSGLRIKNLPLRVRRRNHPNEWSDPTESVTCDTVSIRTIRGVKFHFILTIEKEPISGDLHTRAYLPENVAIPL
jgi:hypothetical protein